MLTKEDIKLLVEVENYLFSKNKCKVVDNSFIMKSSEIEDPKALELFLKLYNLNEKLLKKGD